MLQLSNSAPEYVPERNGSYVCQRMHTRVVTAASATTAPILAPMPVRGKTETCGEERSHRGILPGPEKGGWPGETPSDAEEAHSRAMGDRSQAQGDTDGMGEVGGCRRFIR